MKTAHFTELLNRNSLQYKSTPITCALQLLLGLNASKKCFAMHLTLGYIVREPIHVFAASYWYMEKMQENIELLHLNSLRNRMFYRLICMYCWAWLICTFFAFWLHLNVIIQKRFVKCFVLLSLHSWSSSNENCNFVSSQVFINFHYFSTFNTLWNLFFVLRNVSSHLVPEEYVVEILFYFHNSHFKRWTVAATAFLLEEGHEFYGRAMTRSMAFTFCTQVSWLRSTSHRR